MWQFDPEEITRSHECRQASQFRQLATAAILSRLTERTTQEQYDLALESLAALQDEYLGRLDAFHHSPLYGRHKCITNVCQELAAVIRAASLLAPVPQPEVPPEPAPEPPRRSLREVMQHFDNVTETYLGDIVEGDERE
jgi:hypothetical protein